VGVILHPDHVTIAVRDVDAAIAFFGLLGFVEAHVAEIDGGEPAAYMGMPTMHADHVTLVLDGADPRFEIQLLHFHEPVPDASFTVDAQSRRARVGLNHLALRVDDLAATRAQLAAHGVAPINDEMDYISRRLQFFEGPDGVTIELVEARPD
jgi:catechol 2,3-dioxygenase-like lactoylglutathione lyase family enzyme